MGAVCMMIFVAFGVVDSNGAAKDKGKKSAVKDQGDMQCREVTMIGVVSEEKLRESKDENKKAKPYRVFTDAKKKEWVLPREKKDDAVNLKEYEGVKVKLTCMVLGEKKITGIKSIEKIAK